MSARGCDRCGHTRREHNIPPRPENDQTLRLCSAPVGNRLCLCPYYIKPPLSGGSVDEEARNG